MKEKVTINGRQYLHDIVFGDLKNMSGAKLLGMSKDWNVSNGRGVSVIQTQVLDAQVLLPKASDRSTQWFDLKQVGKVVKRRGIVCIDLESSTARVNVIEDLRQGFSRELRELNLGHHLVSKTSD